MSDISPLSPPIVAIGASAGGINALEKLLGALPTDTDLAYVVVEHLDPKRTSHLAEVLARFTRMPVRLAKDGDEPAANTVYVIPPGVYLEMKEGKLRLVPVEPDRSPLYPVNRFLLSLATEDRPTIGVILSGAGSDGAAGVRELKERGGFVLVQSPDSAQQTGMPESAIATGCADYILPPTGIAEELVHLCRQPSLTCGSESPWTDKLRTEIYTLLRAASGTDFTHYKQSTLIRRMMRRTALLKLPSPESYLERLRRDPSEVDALYKELLIHVTRFFRDAEAYEALQRLVFPALLHDRPKDEPIRVWVPACATGEEVYSIAILLVEHLEQNGREVPFQLFGTDLSETAVEKARNAVFPPALALELSPERLERFFSRTTGGYQVVRSLRDVCVFAQQDVTANPPLSRMDLVSCRNLLIYLGPALQQKVLPMLHYALKPGGFLWLGQAEVIDAYPELFSPVDKTHKIYARKSVTPRLPLPLSATGRFSSARLEALRQSPLLTRSGEIDLNTEGGRLLLANYSPPAVLIDEHFDVLHFWGHTGPYLDPGTGRASLNLLRLARKDLSNELRRLVDEMKEKKLAACRRNDVRILDPEGLRTISLRAITVKPPLSGQEVYYLIVFEETPRSPAAPASAIRSSEGPSSAEADVELNRLHDELDATRHHLHRIIEEREVANEELQSAHEEVLSSNEELQTINQELETAKEELQSANEELTTINDELQRRHDELKRAYEFSAAVFESIHEPVMVLNHKLEIQQANRAFYEAFSRVVRKGRAAPLSQLGEKWAEEQLLSCISSVLQGKNDYYRFETECEISELGNRHFHVSVSRITTPAGDARTLLVSLHDITERRQMDETRNLMATIVESANDGIIGWKLDGTVIAWNLAAQQIFGYSADEIIGNNISVLVPKESTGEMHDLIAGVKAGKSFRNLEVVRLTKDGRRRDVSLTVSPLRSPEGEVMAASVTVRDITEHKRAMEELRQSEEKFRLVVSSVREYAIFHLDPDGHITSWNEGAQRIKGYSPEEILGKHFSIFYTEEERRAGVPEKALQTARVEGKFEVEAPRVRRGGDQFEAHVLITPLWDGGKLRGFSKVTQDITARRRAERRMAEQADELRRQSRLLELVNDAILFKDTQNRITFWNEGAARQYGWSREEALARDPDELLRTEFPLSKDHIHQELRQCGYWEGELVHYTREGKRLVVRSRWSAQRDADGNLTGTLELNTNITAENEARQNLVTMNEMLERTVNERTAALRRSNEELERFAYVSSHDLKEPVRMVSNFAGLLDRKYRTVLDDDGRQYLDFLKTGAQRMYRLVDDLLKYGRIDATPVFEQVNLKDAIETAKQNIRSAIEESRAVIRVEGGLPAVDGDLTLLSQVFQNLFDNAIKFRSSSPPEVVVRASRMQADWLVSVTDNGIGIEAGFLDRIFVMFQRLHTQSKYPGSGIGLASCKKIVERHGGKMWAESTPGKGTTFHFTLPVSRSPGPGVS